MRRSGESAWMPSSRFFSKERGREHAWRLLEAGRAASYPVKQHSGIQEFEDDLLLSSGHERIVSALDVKIINPHQGGVSLADAIYAHLHGLFLYRNRIFVLHSNF